MGLPTKGVSVLAARRLWWPLTLVAALLVAPHAHYGAATVPSRAAAPADQAFTLASAPSTSARPASSQIAGVEMELGGLDRRLATLDAQIPSTKAQIASDRQELVTLERAIYVQPSSLLVLAGEAGNVTDLLDRLAEVTSVGAHAHAVELSLNSNVALLSVEKEQRQVAADHRARLYAELVGLSAAQVWDQITIWERANQN
ncbi:MAG: hypothetical protein ACREPA_11970, partial [Candidatus Dormibacteraceae bacterium]